jgi:hypothetical protein
LQLHVSALVGHLQAEYTIILGIVDFALKVNFHHVPVVLPNAGINQLACIPYVDSTALTSDAVYNLSLHS